MVRSDTPVTERLVQAVSAYADTDPLDLPLLYDAVDPDALDAFVGGLSDGTVRFRYAGYSVSVDHSGAIHLDDRRVAGPSAGNVAIE